MLSSCASGVSEDVRGGLVVGRTQGGPRDGRGDRGQHDQRSRAGGGADRAQVGPERAFCGAVRSGDVRGGVQRRAECSSAVSHIVGRSAQSLSAGCDAAGAPHRAATGPRRSRIGTLEGSGFRAGPFGLRRVIHASIPRRTAPRREAASDSQGAPDRSRRTDPGGATRAVPGGLVTSLAGCSPLHPLARGAGLLAPGPAPPDEAGVRPGRGATAACSSSRSRA